MASRSPLFKPHMAKLAPTAPGHHRGRPPFTRTSSASPAISTTSEDSLISRLKGLTTLGGEAEVGLAYTNYSQTRAHTPTQMRPHSSGGGIDGVVDKSAHPSLDIQEPFGSETPGRRRSQPIPIELPGRKRNPIYTPLSARGELQGGYFPNHEEIQRLYRGHPFDSNPNASVKSGPHIGHSFSSPTMSEPSSLSPLSCPSESSTTVRQSHHHTSPYHLPPLANTDNFIIPCGKFYPSNYKKPSPTTASSRSPKYASSLQLTPGPQKPQIHQRTSEVKQKLQQYQRQMIEQARLAKDNPLRVYTYNHNTQPINGPMSPRLIPALAGSPLGTITPLELEAGDAGGYLFHGFKTGRGKHAEGKDEGELVGNLIRSEDESIFGQARHSPSGII